MEAGNRKILMYRPAEVWLVVGVGTLLLALAAYLVFQLGRQQGGAELRQLQRQRGLLDQQVEQQQGELMALREQLAVLQRASEIDRQASLEVRDDFARVQGELLGLRKELDFYRGIVSPGEAEPGLRIQSFHLEPASQDGAFLYDLTLTQVRRNERFVTGVVEIEVEGVEDGLTKRLPFATLVAGDGKVLKFRFRYFQRFAGKIQLPDRFQPRRVTIRLSPRGKGQPAGVEQTLEWPA
jgi:hypothetical protein